MDIMTPRGDFALNTQRTDGNRSESVEMNFSSFGTNERKPGTNLSSCKLKFDRGTPPIDDRFLSAAMYNQCLFPNSGLSVPPYSKLGVTSPHSQKPSTPSCKGFVDDERRFFQWSQEIPRIHVLSIELCTHTKQVGFIHHIYRKACLEGGQDSVTYPFSSSSSPGSLQRNVQGEDEKKPYGGGANREGKKFARRREPIAPSTFDQDGLLR